MRKCAVIAALIVAVLTFSVPSASANQVVTGPDVYSTSVAPNGDIQCASAYGVLGEALAPHTLFVVSQALRVHGIMCPPVGLGGPSGDLYTNYRVMAYGLYGWFVCRDWRLYPATNNPGGFYAQYNESFTGCGTLPYQLEMYTVVYLQVGTGFWQPQVKTLFTWPTAFNG